MDPLLRAIGQMDDPAFLGVIARSLAWAALSFLALVAGSVAIVDHLLVWHGWLAWLGYALSGIGVALLAFTLYLPVAAIIGTLYFDRIARAVERRHYPWLSRPEGAPIAAQTWDALALGLRVLALNVVALVAALLLPGIGILLGWAIAAYAIGRGLFMAVAMRRMPRPAAEGAYRAARGRVLLQGAALALASYVPLLNLLLPVIGIATMVHVLDATLARPAAVRSQFRERNR